MAPAPAFAHAFPVSETPRSGAVLRVLPPDVSIDFTESVNRHFSGIVVKAPDGRTVSQGMVTVGHHDPKSLTIGLRRSRQTGRFTVLWHALSRDGHRTAGRYGFDIRP